MSCGWAWYHVEGAVCGVGVWCGGCRVDGRGTMWRVWVWVWVCGVEGVVWMGVVPCGGCGVGVWCGGCRVDGCGGWDSGSWVLSC